MNGNNIPEEVGQDRIGYTEDGFVFMLVWSQWEGKPIKTIMQWTPTHAKEIVNSINKAVEGAEKKSIPKFMEG